MTEVAERPPEIVGPLPDIPADAEQLTLCLADPMWRLQNLYWILIKGTGTQKGQNKQMLFRPNLAQRRFMERIWHRNIILKARQLGFTTLVAILWLDYALFNPNARCGMIAQDAEAAEALFKDKVKFAYDNLPAALRRVMPLKRDRAAELLFAHNNSSLRVATSMRSGTLDRLHVSEFGKICAKDPAKAAEVVNGSLPALAPDGIGVIESTAEGRTGSFFEMTEIAQRLMAQAVELIPEQWRFHFFPWYEAPEYRADSSRVPITRAEHDYFDLVEAATGARIDPDQRAWYISTRDNTFSGAVESMWQEYPSTPEEAFQVSTEGNYYAKDMIALRKRGGITRVPRLDVPVNTFWDIGNKDGVAVWFHQETRGEDRFIDYMEAHGETLAFYVTELRKRGYTFGQHFLPHDADHKRLSDTNRSTKDLLQILMPGEKFRVVPIITQLQNGIDQTRKHLKNAWFDKEGTKEGVTRIDGYQKTWNNTDKRWSDTPNKANGCSEGADALRQWAQAKERGMLDAVVPTTHEDLPEAPDWRL